MRMRRLMLMACLWGAMGTGVVPGQARPQTEHDEGSLAIYLVGTGGPELTPTRAGEATLIEANGERLLFDAGRGVLQGLYECRIPPASVTKIFLTHLHSDHIEGLPELWMTPWFLLGRTQPLEVWGPPGTKAMIDGMRVMYGHDLEHRVNAVARREYLDVVVHEVQPGVVYSSGGVMVTAVGVDHRDGNPALGYAVRANGRTVVLTGDATYGEALVAAGRGADVLISNVAAGTAALERSGKIDPILDKLMRPEQAAKMFVEDAPRLAVYSHLVKKGLPGDAGDAVLVRRTRAAGYRGRLLVGQDRMEIVVGKVIRVLPPRSLKGLAEFDGPGSTFVNPATR
jgi:ribonuclease Z